MNVFVARHSRNDTEIVLLHVCTTPVNAPCTAVEVSTTFIEIIAFKRQGGARRVLVHSQAHA